MIQPRLRSRVAEALPRLRSKKNSGCLAEDILYDIRWKPILLGNGNDGLARPPQGDHRLDRNLALGKDGGAPAEPRIDDDLGFGRELRQP
jgi:hypothetical protein